MSASHLRLIASATTSVEGMLPPHDLDTEAGVLSTILNEGGTVDAVDRYLRPEHFYSDANRRIFQACLEIRKTGVLPDTLTVLGWLKDRGWLERVGGTAYVVETLPAAPALDRIDTYARRLVDKWRVRQVIELCQRTAAQGYLDHGEPQDYVDGLTKASAAFGRQGTAGRLELNTEALGRILREASKACADDAEGVKGPVIRTGFGAFDRIMGGGMRAGQKVTIAAMTGGGKSILGLQLGIMAAQQGVGVVVFTGEMSADELRHRALAYGADVDSNTIPTGKLDEDAWRRLHTWAAQLAKLPFEIEPAASLNVGNLRARTMGWIERMRIEHKVPLGLIVVDYVQRVPPTPDMATRPRHEQIGHTTTALKSLAQEAGIVVVELAQSKEPEDRKKKRDGKPGLQCIRECRKIEDEADAIVHIWEHGGRSVGVAPRRVMLVAPKVRGSGSAEAEVTLYPAFARFE